MLATMDHSGIDPASSGARSLTSLAFGQLRADILSGQLRPDERLRIQALSDRYRIGSTAIREALSRLVTDGFVESEDQRGFRVASVSREDLVDLTRTRIGMECMALAQSIERGGVEWESGLLSAFHRLSRTPAPSSPDLVLAWADLHCGFHEALIGGCGSHWTLRLCRLLHDRSERYRNLANRYTGDRGRDRVAEHRALMDAAMARDTASAQRLLTEHYSETTEIVLTAAFGDGRGGA
jgi:GntR family transcriptional regulator, carbon starvation induced regulator